MAVVAGEYRPEAHGSRSSEKLPSRLSVALSDMHCMSYWRQTVMDCCFYIEVCTLQQLPHFTLRAACLPDMLNIITALHCAALLETGLELRPCYSVAAGCALACNQDPKT